jgi:putative transposase
MARKLRLEFPGAIYHVINRGNYRSDLFGTQGARGAFVRCLFEACQKFQWLLHAFVVMRNHFHLALETPEANLVCGMHWLETTFACRFNRLRDERGHLFQGRYKAILFEDGEALGRLCHYVYLNPARAGIVRVEELHAYTHGSFWYLWHPKKRPDFLGFEAALAHAGNLPDNPAGWKSYQQYLAWMMEADAELKEDRFAQMCRGWAVGSVEFRKALVDDYKVQAITRAWEHSGAEEIRSVRAAEQLLAGLRRLGKTEIQLFDSPKGAPWKVALALWLKTNTSIGNQWLAQRLCMGAPKSVSVYASWAKGNKFAAHRPFLTQLA